MKRFLKTVQKGCKKLLQCVKRDRVGNSTQNLWARDFAIYLPWSRVNVQENNGRWPLTPIAASPSPRRQFAMEMISTISPSEDQVDAKPEPHSVPSPRPNHKRVRSPTFQPGLLSPKQKKRILTAASTSASDSDQFSEVSSSDEEPEGKKKNGFRYAAPASSPEPALVQGTQPSGSLNEGGKSENPVPEPDPASSFDQESLSLPQSRKALKWFHLDFCPPHALLFFVYHAWVELQHVMAWEHARKALGEALVITSKLPNGFPWLRNGISTDLANEYNWQEDKYCRSKHGPFRRNVAIYAPPAEQERALRELLKHDLDPENIDFPDNLKRLVVPLFRRKHAYDVESRSQNTFRP
ncbi:hypothetical protein ACEPAI_1785 [Sanghuangporus weigelae]